MAFGPLLCCVPGAYFAVAGRPALRTGLQNKAFKGINSKPTCLVLCVEILEVYYESLALCK